MHTQQFPSFRRLFRAKILFPGKKQEDIQCYSICVKIPCLPISQIHGTYNFWGKNIVAVSMRKVITFSSLCYFRHAILSGNGKSPSTHEKGNLVISVPLSKANWLYPSRKSETHFLLHQYNPGRDRSIYRGNNLANTCKG